jgi:hypothetical protein
VTSRNDQRRQRYAEALTAVESLRAAQDVDAAANEKLQRRLREIGDWLELDSVPVSNAFKLLVRDVAAGRPAAEAREHFVDVAHKYSSWRLPQRLWLQTGTRRMR